MRSRVHYAWVVVGVGFVALVMAAGFRSTAGVLLLPLHVVPLALFVHF